MKAAAVAVLMCLVVLQARAGMGFRPKIAVAHWQSNTNDTGELNEETTLPEFPNITNEEDAFRRRDGSDGVPDQQLMQETFFPDFVNQDPIDRPITPLPPVENPTTPRVSFIVDDEFFGSVNSTSSEPGDNLCTLPLDPARLRIESILDSIDFSHVHNLSSLLQFVRIAFDGAKTLLPAEYANQSFSIDLSNETFAPFVYVINTNKSNAMAVTNKLRDVESLYNFTQREAIDLAQEMLDCINGGFVHHFNRPGFEILSSDWFVYNLNAVAVKCDSQEKLQVLFFSSLVEGKFLEDRFNFNTTTSLQNFLNKWLWTQFMDSLSCQPDEPSTTVSSSSTQSTP